MTLSSDQHRHIHRERKGDGQEGRREEEKMGGRKGGRKRGKERELQYPDPVLPLKSKNEPESPPPHLTPRVTRPPLKPAASETLNAAAAFLGLISSVALSKHWGKRAEPSIGTMEVPGVSWGKGRHRGKTGGLFKGLLGWLTPT